MADRERRFRREIAETDRRIESYLSEVRRLYEGWIRDQIDAFNFEDDPVEQDAILAALRSGDFPLELEDELEDVLFLYVEELSNLQGRFSINTDDVGVTEQLSITEQDGLRAELVTSSTQIASTMAFAAASAAGAVSFASLGADFISGRFNRLNAALTTNLAGYRSTFEIRKAQEVDNEPRFRYIGPKDSKNRPFCRFVLVDQDKLWTLDEINELDNRPDTQLLPVFVYGGGYNCRHRWIYIRRS